MVGKEDTTAYMWVSTVVELVFHPDASPKNLGDAHPPIDAALVVADLIATCSFSFHKMEVLTALNRAQHDLADLGWGVWRERDDRTKLPGRYFSNHRVPMRTEAHGLACF